MLATAGGTISSSQFQGVTLVEQLNLSSGGNNVTLSNTLIAGSSVGYFAVVDGGGSDTIDANTITAMPIVFFAGAGSDTFTGGGGNDAVFIAPTDLTSADTLQGGPGADNLYLNAAGTVSASAFTNVSGFEGLSLSSFGNTVTLTNGLVTGASYFSINDGGGNDSVDASAVTTTPIVFFAGAGSDTFTGGGGNDAVYVAVADLTSADSLQGGAGVDNLYLTTAGTVPGSAFANVGGFEGLVLSGLGNNVTLTNGLVAGSSNGMFAVADGAGSDTVDASGVTNGSSVVIFANSGADTFKGGNGLNGYSFAVADLTSADTVVGGSAVDNLVFTTAGTLAASAFTNVTGIEALVLANGVNNVTLTEGLVAATNIGYFAVVGGTSDDTVDASGITTGVAIVFNGITGGNDGFTGGNGSDSFQFAAGQLTAADTVVGGGGGGADTLWMTTAGTTNTADLAGVSGIEGVYLQNGGTFNLANGITAAAGISATGSSAVDNFDASAVTTYAVSFTGNGGADTLTGGSQNDKFFIADSAFTSINGNGGIDRITLAVPAQSFNLTANAAKITNLEVIDLDSSLNSTLTLAGTDIALVNAVGTSLYVVGDVDDTVNAGNGYTQINSGVVNAAVAAGHTFNEYLHSSGSHLFIDTAITAATATTGNGSASVPEGTAAGATVFDAQQAGATTYVLGGADAALFSIDGTGKISFNASPDFETALDQGTNNVYDLTVTSSNGTATPNFVETVAITVTDVNAAPVFTSGTTGSEAENTPIANVVYDANATDDGENTGALAYSLSAGGDNDRFDINASTGEVTFKVAPNFEAPTDSDTDNVYDITVHANDGAFDVTRAVAISVTDVNATPVFTSGTTGTEAENTPIANVVYDANATDDGENTGSLTYSLSAGGDNDRFDINASTGEVTFKVAPNFEAPTDSDTDNVYDITVHANDGGFDVTQAVAISVTDVNATPVFTSGATGSEAENTPIANVVYDANATDDGENTGSLAYSLSAGGDNDRFDINASTGEVTFKVSPNFEAPTDSDTDNVYDITVHANDGAFDVTQAVAISVTNVNAAPVFTSGTTGTEAENTPIANVVYDANATDDGENSNTLIYSLSAGGDNDRFNINASTGEVTFKLSPNVEAPADVGGNNIYDITVHANDGTLDTTQTVAITVTNVNEEPQTTNVTATGNEDPTAPNYIPITLAGTDVDSGDTIASYHVTSLPTGTATGTLFTDSSLTTAVVAGNTYAATGGTLTLYFKPDANSNGSVTFNAAAIDSFGLEDATPATETINVTAINDAPVDIGVPASLTVQSGFAQPITGLSISDVDAGSATNLVTTLASAGGTIAVGATAGVVISGSGTGSVTLTGSVTTISNALAGNNVTFTATDGAATPTTTTLTITTNDAGNTGLDPGLTGNATSEQDSDTIQIGVTPQVWFIDINQTISDGTAPRGSQANPFTDITEFNGSSGPGNNDYVYLKAGTYNGPGINLKDGQTLLGDDQALSFNIPGGGTVNIESASGARPTIHVTTAGDQGIDVASGNTIRGINIQTDANNSGLDDGTGANNVGTLTVSNVAISGVGKAVDLDGSGTLAVTLESISSTGATADGIDLTGVGGSFTVTGGTTISNAGTTGIHVQNSTAGATFNFGNTNVAGAAGTGVDLASNIGNVTFADLDINGDVGARSFLASGNTGTITSTSGTIVQNGGGGGFAISGATTLNMALDSLNVSNTSVTGIDLNQVKGNLTVGTTTIANNTLVGVQVQNSASGSTMDFGNTTVSGTHSVAAVRLGIAGNGNVGNITFDDLDMAITGPGVVATANTGTTTISAGTISTGTGNAIDLTSNTGGTFNLGGGTGDVDITTTSGTGFNATGGATLNVTGASNTIQTGTGQVLNWSGVGIGASNATFATLQSTGTVANTAIALNNVDNNTFNGGAVTIAGTSGGTSDGIRIDGGSSAAFNFTSATIDNTGDDGIDLNGANGVVTFTTVNLDGMAGNGIEITGNTNPVNINGGSIGATNDAAGLGVQITGGTGNVTIDATIKDDTAANFVAQVTGRTGGTVDFNGLITSNSGGGIDLNVNGGGTIRFDGGMNLSTGAAPAFNATGGGIVIVTDTASTANIITTTSGAALNVANTTIGADDLTFQSITAGTGAGSAGVGISLDNTGSVGGLHVTGTGSAGSGGTIQHKTGANGSTTGGIGIYLNNTAEVQLDRMQLHDFDNFAIRASDVNGFTLQNSVVSGNNGNDAGSDEGAIFFANSSGTINIANSQISGGFEDNLRVLYDSATADTAVYNITNNDFTDLQSGNNALINLSSTTTASTASNVTFNIGNSSNAALGNTFDNSANQNPAPAPATQWFGDGILVTFEGGFQHTINIDNNTFFELFQAIDFAVNFSADVNARIYNNTITYTEGVGAIAFGTGSSSTSAMLFQMLVEDNDIGGLGNDSGSRLGSGIVGDFRGAETSRVTIHQNVVQDTEVNPINIISQMTLGQDGDTHLRITNNTVASIDDDEGGGAGVIPGIQVTTNAATNGDIFLTLTGNTSTGINEEGVLLRQATANNTFQIEDLSPASGATGPQVEAFLEGLNTSTVRVRTGGSVVQYTAMNNNNTNTPAPLTPLLAADGGVQASSLTPGETHLTQTQLDSVVAAAIAQWANAGASTAQLAALAAITFTVTDLAGKTIGDHTPGHIVIDADAGGHGWFVDPTPNDHSEFAHAQNAAGTDLLTDSSSAAAGHLDLLTAVAHEMGHELGLEDAAAPGDTLMYVNLVDGERRLPDAADVAQTHEADIPQISLAPAGTPILAGNAANNTIDAGHGGMVLLGGAGADTFVFGPSIQLDAPTPQITHVADYSAAQGDTFDFSALTSKFHNSSASDSLVVRAVEDASGKFATLQVDHIDPNGLPSAPNWVSVAQLDGAHAGDVVNILIDNHSVHLAQIHVDLLV